MFNSFFLRYRCTLLLAAILLSFILTVPCGCKQDTPPAKVAPTRQLLQQGSSVTTIEIPSEAIPIWRAYRDQHPTLLIFSDDPLLQPIDPEHTAEIAALTNNGSAADILDRSPLRANALFQPSQTLSSALQQKFFNSVVWVVAISAENRAGSLHSTADQLFKVGAIDDYDRTSFEETPHGLSGHIGKIPLQIVFWDNLPDIEGPIVTHIDLSFFNTFYDNEIKTPFFATLLAWATQIRDRHYKSLAVTLSYSNLSGWVPLDMRFAGEVLAKIFDSPQILDQPLPKAWQIKKESLYLSTFFQNEKRYSLFAPLVANPETATADVFWERYRTAIKFKPRPEAFAELDKAIALDPAYAQEYATLAITVEEKGKDATELWQKAALTAPNDPYVQLQYLRTQSDGKPPSATIKKKLEQLRALPWAKDYNAPIIEEIDRLLGCSLPPASEKP